MESDAVMTDNDYDGRMDQAARDNAKDCQHGIFVQSLMWTCFKDGARWAIANPPAKIADSKEKTDT